MPRSCLAAIVAAILVLPLLVAPSAVRGAAPTADDIVAVAEARGLSCDPPSEPGPGAVHVSCANLELAVTFNGHDRTGFATVSMYTDAPASSFEGLVTDVALLFCPGEEAAIREAIAIDEGPRTAGGCQLEGTSDKWATSVTIQEAAPSPSASPMTGERPTQGGTWTYEGSWTLTVFANDGGFDDPELQLGDTRPGLLRISCDTPTAAFCGWESEMDGEPWWVLSVPMAGPGELLGIEEETSDDCPGGESHRDTHRASFGGETATASVENVTEPRTCDTADGGTLYHTDMTWTFGGALTAFVPAQVEPSAAPQPSQDANEAPVPVPTADDGVAGIPAAPTAGRPFADAVPAVGEISTDPVVLLQSALLAALLVFLMPFPSQLFNSTLETHEDEVRRWFRLDRLGAAGAGVGAFWASWPGVALFTLLAALLYGFLDPGFGISLASLATFVGMLLGIVLVTAAFAVPAVLAHRRIGAGWTPKVVPLSLLIGVACVLLSRVTGFQPGYLYGLLIGLAFAAELSAAEEGRATALGAIAMLGIAFGAWLALGAMPDGDGFGPVVARTALAALMVAGLEGVVFGLLPMRFLPGESLYAWNRVAWGALLAIGAFAFFHILINPASGYLSDTSRTPLFTVLGLLIGFSLVSVAFWAWFRFRTEPAAVGEV